MRKVIAILLTVLLVLCCTGCGHTFAHDRNVSGSITYTYGTQTFTEALSAAEISKIVDILDGKLEVLVTPNCGFSSAVSFTVGGCTYALARDGCPLLVNCGTNRCITLSEGERQTLEALFVSRGGMFPCA